ncbi:hypothetical protein BG006_000091 [Podila minutissima]|uniref:GDP-fucose protein O-fucosyltransferase 2 n=1 Tax=Podila minutissima TaxID=64525 RepID=A0A9P5SBR1_9FUNG|nr:hypothetical protein BG006_000091 [Podila minutissima]
MPASPKSPKPLYGLPARPSSGRRCHSQKRILMLFSIILLVSSGSMIVFHITSPFSRSGSLSCRSSTSSSSSSTNCVASRSSRWKADNRGRPVPAPDEDLAESEDINSDAYRNHDRPRAALPHLNDNGVPEFELPKQQQQQHQQPSIGQESQELPNASSNIGEEAIDENVVSPSVNKDDSNLAPETNPSGVLVEDEEEQDYDQDHGEEDEAQDEGPIPFEETLENIDNEDIDPDTKYLVYLPYAGITNQFYGMLRGMEVAKATGRTLIIPPITASSHDKSKQNQPWSKFLDLKRFTDLTGIKVVEFHQLRDREQAEMSSLTCGITCGFGSKREIDFTAKGFLKQWKFELTLTPLRQDVNKLETITSLLTPYQDDRYVCISNTYKISVKDKLEWERFGQYLHFTQEMEDFVQEFLDANLTPSESGQHRYITIHARRGDFAEYCANNFAGPKLIHCLPSTEQFAERIDQVQQRLNPALESSSASSMTEMLPVFVATNERRPEELRKFSELGWRYLDHEAMGTAERLGVFGPMIIDQVMISNAEAAIGIQMSTFSRVGALRQRDWHQRSMDYM